MDGVQARPGPARCGTHVIWQQYAKQAEHGSLTTRQLNFSSELYVYGYVIAVYTCHCYGSCQQLGDYYQKLGVISSQYTRCPKMPRLWFVNHRLGTVVHEALLREKLSIPCPPKNRCTTLKGILQFRKILSL